MSSVTLDFPYDSVDLVKSQHSASNLTTFQAFPLPGKVVEVPYPVDLQGRALNPAFLQAHSQSHKFETPLCFHSEECTLVIMYNFYGRGENTTHYFCARFESGGQCRFHIDVDSLFLQCPRMMFSLYAVRDEVVVCNESLKLPVQFPCATVQKQMPHPTLYQVVNRGLCSTITSLEFHGTFHSLSDSTEKTVDPALVQGDGYKIPSSGSDGVHRSKSVPVEGSTKPNLSDMAADVPFTVSESVGSQFKVSATRSSSLSITHSTKNRYDVTYFTDECNRTSRKGREDVVDSISSWDVRPDLYPSLYSVRCDDTNTHLPSHGRMKEIHSGWQKDVSYDDEVYPLLARADGMSALANCIDPSTTEYSNVRFLSQIFADVNSQVA